MGLPQRLRPRVPALESTGADIGRGHCRAWCSTRLRCGRTPSNGKQASASVPPPPATLRTARSLSAKVRPWISAGGRSLLAVEFSRSGASVRRSRDDCFCLRWRGPARSYGDDPLVYRNAGRAASLWRATANSLDHVVLVCDAGRALGSSPNVSRREGRRAGVGRRSGRRSCRTKVQCKQGAQCGAVPAGLSGISSVTGRQ